MVESRKHWCAFSGGMYFEISPYKAGRHMSIRNDDLHIFLPFGEFLKAL